MRRGITVLVMAAASLLGTGAVPATTAAAAAHGPACPTGWGTGAKHAGKMVSTRVRKVTAGQHTCFDRLVIEMGTGPMPGYRVRYVARITEDGSGKVIKVKGKAKLSITVDGPARTGFPLTSRHLVDVTGFRSFRQVVAAGSFEGITSFGVGVRARLPFRVLLLNGPGTHSRLVIDVAHRS